MARVKSSKFSIKGKGNRFKLILLLVILLAIPVTVFLANRLSFLLPNAQQAGVQLSFTNQASGNNNNVTLRLGAGSNQIGFAKAVILFDRNKMRLSSEVVPSTRLKTVVVKTSMADANSTGRIEVSLGLSTEDRANPPTGTFDLAQMSFTTTSTQTNDATQITIDQSNSQIADLVPNALAISATNLSLILNFQPTASPTMKPTASPTQSAKPTATPTMQATMNPTMRPTATPTVRPTATPRATATPVVQPSQTPTTTTPPVGGPSNQVTWLPQNSYDMANQEGSTVRNPGVNNHRLFLGCGANTQSTYMGIRFSGQAVPQGKKVTSAMLAISPSDDTYIRTAVKINTELSSNPFPFSNTNKISTRSLSEQSSTFRENVRWTKGTVYYYDVTKSVQEFFQKQGNNATTMALISKCQDYQYGRKYLESAGEYGPKLIINYSNEGEGSATPRPGGGGAPSKFIEALIRLLQRLGYRVTR